MRILVPGIKTSYLCEIRVKFIYSEKAIITENPIFQANYSDFLSKGQLCGLKNHLVSQTQVGQTQNLWNSDQNSDQIL